MAPFRLNWQGYRARLGRDVGGRQEARDAFFRTLATFCVALGLSGPVFAADSKTTTTPPGPVSDQPLATATTIDFNTPAITGSATTANPPATQYLTQGIEFVDPAVQPVSHPISISYAGSYLILDPTHARGGKQALASYLLSDENLEQTAGFLIHFTKFSDKVSLYAGAYRPNTTSAAAGATVQMTGYDADGNVVADTSVKVDDKVSTPLSISTKIPSIAYVSVQIPGFGAPMLEVDDLSFETPGNAALTTSKIATNGVDKISTGPDVGIVKLPGDGAAAPLVVPKILSVSQGVAKPVTVVGDKPFSDASAIYFGKVAQTAVQINGNSVYAYPPSDVLPGSNSDISVLLKNAGGEAMVYSHQTAEVPLGEVDENGPIPTNPFDTPQDDSWQKGQGHSFNLGSPKNLMVDNKYPVFYITVQSTYSSALESKAPFGLTSYAGDKAIFGALLEMCSITAKNTTKTNVGPYPQNITDQLALENSTGTKNNDGDCTNWDGTSGVWVTEGAPVTKSMTATTGIQYLGVPTGAVVFDGKNYVRTLRVLVGVEQTDTQGWPIGIPIRNAMKYTEPFNVIVSPNAYYQIKVQPELIVYAPPGDQSTVTYTANNQYFTSYTNGNSATQTNTTTQDDDNSWSASLKMSAGYSASNAGGSGAGASASASFTEGLGGGLDTSTSNGTGVQNGSQLSGSSAETLGITYTSQANANTTPGNGMVCASATNCSTQTQVKDWWQNEPFWNDSFYLQVHPQYVYYVLGNNTDRSVMYASVNGYSKVQVLSLWACTAGIKLYGLDQCSLSYTDVSIESSGGQTGSFVGTSNTVELTPAEAQNLLALDPFYVGGQGADISVDRASIIKPNVNYGSRIGVTSANSATVAYNNTQIQSQNNNGMTTYTSSVTNTTSATESVGGGFALSFIVGYDFADTSTDKSSTAILAQNQSVYTNSTATNHQTVVSISGFLNDVDNVNGGGACKTCHDPLANYPSVNIYLDRVFGGFMFQDTNANPAPSAAQRAAWEAQFDVAAMSISQEQNNQRFSDVDNGSSQKSAIGMMVRLAVMSGYADGKFHPNDPMTRAQLAIALNRALLLAAPATSVTFSDIPEGAAVLPAARAVVSAGLLAPAGTKFNPADSVSLDDFHSVLSHAFKSVPTAAKTGSASLTRGEAAQVLLAALQARN
jgi:hypothetical protein